MDDEIHKRYEDDLNPERARQQLRETLSYIQRRMNLRHSCWMLKRYIAWRAAHGKRN